MLKGMQSDAMSYAANNFSDRKRRFHDFLTRNPVGVLSTVTPEGKPHGTMIYFTVDDDFTISFLTKSETQKSKNLRHNDCVMLTVCEPHSQAVIQVTGRTEEVADGYKVNGIAGAVLAASLKTSDSGLPPISKLDAGTYVGFRIKPEQARMAIYAPRDPGEYSDLFESLESFELEPDRP